MWGKTPLQPLKVGGAKRSPVRAPIDLFGGRADEFSCENGEFS